MQGSKNLLQIPIILRHLVYKQKTEWLGWRRGRKRSRSRYGYFIVILPIIDVIAELLRRVVIDRSGKFVMGLSNTRVRYGGEEPAYVLVFTADDAKTAFNLKETI